ncbi:ATP-binding protein [Streptomyces sp. NPDC004609]|uniref:ATP-binding protein n=1 Tax=Streptomyces sp. NPDC004609 TaxID=3364704 RepID=UPI0036ACA52E
MTRTRTWSADPQPAVSDRLRQRLEAQLAARGIAPGAGRSLPADLAPAPLPALEAAQLRIPADYRDAVADHPAVAAWVRAITGSATAPYAGDRHAHYGRPGRLEIRNGPSLLLWGPTGTGKTRQAFGAIRSLTAAGCAVRWHAVKAADLYGQMRSQNTDTEAVLQHAMRIPLLVLDDLGAAKTTAWNEDITFRLLAWRGENHLPTLVTTNLPPTPQPGAGMRQELRTAVGDRILSRLSGMCTAVELSGPDRRYSHR